MKKTLLVILIAVLCATNLFAFISAGVTVNKEKVYGEDEIRWSIDFGGYTFWKDDPFEKKGFNFSFLTEFGIRAAIDDVNGYHTDLSLSLLPGVMYVFGDFSAVNLSAGLVGTRIGYYCGVKEVDGWDGVLSIITFGLLGANPSRKLAAAVDLRVNLGFIGFGGQITYPIVQSTPKIEDKGTKDGFSYSAFVTFGLK